MKKRVRFLALFLCLLCVLSSCGPQVEVPDDPLLENPNAPIDDGSSAFPETVIPLTEVPDGVFTVGRTMMTETGVAADWSGSGIMFRAKCRQVIYATVTASHDCVFGVVIDGVQRDDVMVKAGTAEYPIYTNLRAGYHTVYFLKQSAVVTEENQALLTSIDSIRIFGSLTGEDISSEFLVEFVGDSITCGVGTVRESMEPKALNSAAYWTARRGLFCDYSLVAVPGIGLVRSEEKHGLLNILDVYGKQSPYRSGENFNPERKADVVVVNLGTTDRLFAENFTQREYKSAIKTLVTMIREKHGAKVPIIWMVGMMAEIGVCDYYVLDVFTELGGNGAGLYTLQVTNNTAGTGGYPSKAAQEVVAAELNSYIQMRNFLKSKKA